MFNLMFIYMNVKRQPGGHVEMTNNNIYNKEIIFYKSLETHAGYGNTLWSH